MGAVSADRHGDSADTDSVVHRWEAQELRLSEARILVSRWLDAHRLPDMEPTLHLAITELLSNAREASRPANPITLRMDVVDNAVDVEVENIGVEFNPSFDMPDAIALRGRGMSLVSAIADSVEVEHVRGRTRVTARFHL